MKLPIYQVDAFTHQLFRGNPAAVVPLQEWLRDEQLLQIAAENNLSETAFYVREADGIALRWFTPAREVDLCGHATLATAFVIFTHEQPEATQLQFRTASGVMAVERESETLWLNFPSRPPVAWEQPHGVGNALRAQPVEVLRTRLVDSDSDKIVAVFESAREVARLEPDMNALMSLEGQGVVATAPGVEGIDFVSRYFVPKVGVPEDPVTGSTHCTLTPYWADRFDKPRLTARQLSARGGELECVLEGERVRLGGRAVEYLQGEIRI